MKKKLFASVLALAMCFAFGGALAGCSGEQGPAGPAGSAGAPGADGANGKSAYELWKELPGNEDKTVEEFLASLVGAAGQNGQDGSNGSNGQDGANGKSAYELWKEIPGNEDKTIEEFFASLKGDKGDKGDNGDAALLECTHTAEDDCVFEWVLEEHTMDNGEVVNGTYLYVCNDCGHSEIKVEAHHNYVPQTAQEATCTEPAGTFDKCSICGHITNEQITAPANGHDWRDWAAIVDEDAIVEVNFCEDGGRMGRTCKVCNEVEIKVSEAKPHTVEWDVEHALLPTANATGLLVGTCSDPNCGKAGLTVVLPKLDKTAYAFEEVITVRACDMRQGTQTYSIYVGNEVSLVRATDTTPAYYVADMKNAEAEGYTAVSVNITLGAVAHTLNGLPVVNQPYAWNTPNITEIEDKKANCQTGATGTAVYTCEACSGMYSVVTVRNHDYDYEQKEILVDSTCCEVGTAQAPCKTCGDTTEYDVAKKNHSIQYVLNELENDPDGYTYLLTLTCSTVGCVAANPEAQCTWTEQVKLRDSDVTIVPSTCIKAGTITYTAADGTPVVLEMALANHKLNGNEIIPTQAYDWKTEGVTNIEDKLPKCWDGESQVGAGVEGLGFYSCDVCGYNEDGSKNGVVQSIKTKMAHNYTSKEVTAEPTCTEIGYATIKCGTCGYEGVEEIPANGHTNMKGLRIAESYNGYYEPGQVVEYFDGCTVEDCTYSYSEEVVATWTETLKATCEVEGAGIYKATVGGVVYELTLKVAKTAHNLNGVYMLNGVATYIYDNNGKYVASNGIAQYPVDTLGLTQPEDKKATCTATGTGIYFCSTCGGLYSVTTAKVPHTFDAEPVLPTCTEDGVTTDYCNVCGLEATNTIEAEGHKYEIVIIKAPTFTEAGQVKLVCKNCDIIEKVIDMPALTDDIYATKDVVPSTCNKQGTATYYYVAEDLPTFIVVDGDGEFVIVEDSPTIDLEIAFTGVVLDYAEHGPMSTNQYVWNDTIDGVDYKVYGHLCKTCGKLVVDYKVPVPVVA